MGTPPQRITFAGLLQRYRRAVGLTQEELAERAHLSVRGISNLERGVRRLPQRATVALLAEALALPPKERAALEAAARRQDEPGSAAQPSQPALAGPTNLPAALSSFVGRSWEQAEVRHLLDRARLLTLVGPGGCGKTRLALAVAEERAAAFPDGVWLVELAPVGADGMVMAAVARALGLREESGRTLADTLAAHLASQTALLLLDNCEHVPVACAELADSLLRACPGLRILATSRERLSLTGEVAWPVPPLSLPPEGAGGGTPSLARLAQAEAVQLFVERVRGVRPSFALSAENAPAVDQICRRLDGIPLALELAAARANVLTVTQIAEYLDDRFRLLTGGSRTALPRQRTLRASIDWSYDLLAEAERMLFGRLSVFAGGWTLEAARAVCAGDGVEVGAVLDLLDGLATKSLVQVDGADGPEARYRLLETVRQYAWERLEESDASAALRVRHLDWCAALALEAEPALAGPEQQAWAARLEAEYDNLRAALTWSVREEHHPVSGLRLASALWRFWECTAIWARGGAGWSARWLRRSTHPPPLAPRLCWGPATWRTGTATLSRPARSTARIWRSVGSWGIDTALPAHSMGWGWSPGRWATTSGRCLSSRNAWLSVASWGTAGASLSHWRISAVWSDPRASIGGRGVSSRRRWRCNAAWVMPAPSLSP